MIISSVLISHKNIYIRQSPLYGRKTSAPIPIASPDCRRTSNTSRERRVARCICTGLSKYPLCTNAFVISCYEVFPKVQLMQCDFVGIKLQSRKTKCATFVKSKRSISSHPPQAALTCKATF